jgi:hypothetical protein
VLLLRSSFDQAQNGRPLVTNTLDVFVQVEPGAVDVFARTFHPLFGQTADFNFLETANFIGQLSRTAELNKEGVTNLARRVEGLQPDVRHQFATVVSGMARDATPRVAERALADAQKQN